MAFCWLIVETVSKRRLNRKRRINCWNPYIILENERIILGIDPGTTIMGFGLIKVVRKKMEFLQLNELILSKYDNHYQKLKVIFERTIELIETHHPDEIAIEAPFFGKNVQSMLKLGRAQGVAMAAGLSRGIPITEYEPKKIKMAMPLVNP